MFERYIRDSLGDWTLYTLHCVRLALNYELSREQVRTALLIQAVNEGTTPPPHPQPLIIKN